MENPKQEKPKKNIIDTIIRELAIPLLGCLVPGTYLWMGLLFSIIPPISFLTGTFTTSDSGLTFNLLTYLSTIIQNIKSGSWILFLVISYVLGAIVSKQDPKITDQKSFKRISDQFSSEGKDLANDLTCTSQEDCEYPYPNLYNYLEKRGFDHLLGYITWKDNPGFKSKAFINRLKIDIELCSPDAYQNIVRNEAQIRLTNTVWHSTILLRYCCLFGIALVFISFIIGCFSLGQNKPFNNILRYSLSSIAFPLFILMIGEYFRINIEKIFHFQRLRELFYILETYDIVPTNKKGAK